MIELKLNVSEVDFASLIQLFAGSGVAGSAALLAARALPDSAKEELVVRYLNSNAVQLQSMLEAAAAKKGVHVKISGAVAAIVPEGTGAC